MTRSGWRNIPPALIAGFLLPVAMVIGSLILVNILSKNTAHSGFMLDYGRSLSATIAAARDAEIGQRGHLLTGERRYLAPYSNALREIDPALARMRAKRSARGERRRRARTVVRRQGARAARDDPPP